MMRLRRGASRVLLDLTRTLSFALLRGVILNAAPPVRAAGVLLASQAPTNGK
jgi:hypothetical protein